MKISMLSNVNILSLAKVLQTEADVYIPDGFGAVFEELANPEAKLYIEKVKVVFIYIDLSVLANNPSDTSAAVDEWFVHFKQCIHEDIIYVLFDADWRGGYVADYKGFDNSRKYESYWNEHLIAMCRQNENCYIFPFKRSIDIYGKKEIYSDKSWFLGNLPFAPKAERMLGKEIISFVDTLQKVPKKALVVDLDNTLWGGVIGEDNSADIALSKTGRGAPYYFFQRALKFLKEAGVLLCIVSKNNYSDVEKFFDENENMVLRLDDFIAKRINWERKSENIISIAKELNISVDSFVFVDDSKVERMEVRQNVDGISIIDWPDDIGTLPELANDIYKKYFAKLYITEEDRKKTQEYIENRERKEAEKKYASYNEFLRNLNIKVKRIANPENNLQRVHQLIVKTNQFNLTSQRWDLPQISSMLADQNYIFYLFDVEDCFGDNGIVALVVVNLKKALIEQFIMSCRVMGRKIENCIIDYVENDLRERGADLLRAYRITTHKNKPVEHFYEDIGYECIYHDQHRQDYTLDLRKKTHRDYEALIANES